MTRKRDVLESTIAAVEEDLRDGDGTAPFETLVDLMTDDLIGSKELNPDERVQWEPSLPDLFRIRAELEMMAAAIRETLKAVDAEIVEFVGPGGKVRSGPEFFEVKPSTTFRIREGQEARFWDIVEDVMIESHDTALEGNETRSKELRQAVAALFNPNQVRKTGLKLVNETGHGSFDPETGELGSVWDLFEFISDETPSLQVRPLDKAPKFAAELPDLEVRYGRGKGSTERPSDE